MEVDTSGAPAGGRTYGGAGEVVLHSADGSTDLMPLGVPGRTCKKVIFTKHHVLENRITDNDVYTDTFLILQTYSSRAKSSRKAFYGCSPRGSFLPQKMGAWQNLFILGSQNAGCRMTSSIDCGHTLGRHCQTHYVATFIRSQR